MTTTMWFNSDIWFEMESVGQVTTYPHKTEVFTNTRDVITITFEDDRTARVKRQRGDKVDIYMLGAAAVRYNVEKLKGYAIKHGIYLDVTDPREWQSPVVVEEGQTKDYKGVAAEKAYVVRGYENLYPYPAITALCLPDGSVRLMRYGTRTYKVAYQVRYPDWEEFVKANNFVARIPDEDDLSSVTQNEEDIQEVDVPEEEGVEVGEEETDEDSSSDYEPEKEREFYRAQARDRKRRRIEKTMTIRMAVGGGDDENIDQKLVEVEFHFHNMSSARKTGKLYRIEFNNGSYMLAGKGSITYVRPSGDAVWCEWVKPLDFNEIAVWLWEHPGFERPVIA